jgi:hypothetical protein
MAPDAIDLFGGRMDRAGRGIHSLLAGGSRIEVGWVGHSMLHMVQWFGPQPFADAQVARGREIRRQKGF